MPLSATCPCRAGSRPYPQGDEPQAYGVMPYRRIIDKVRGGCVRISPLLFPDFIVGFPGESEADFEATMQLVADIGFASAFPFKYSTRPGTPAADDAAQIAEAVKARAAGAAAGASGRAAARPFNRATGGQGGRGPARKNPVAIPASSAANRPICRRYISMARGWPSVISCRYGLRRNQAIRCRAKLCATLVEKRTPRETGRRRMWHDDACRAVSREGVRRIARH